MTKEEARNKICPKMIARMYLDHRSGATEYDYSYCIASDCMMWRWIEVDVTEVSKVNKKHPEWTGQQCYDSLKQRGYCGLGGRP